MTHVTTEAARLTGRDQADIRPFRVSVPETELTDLQRRINATKWPERETVADASQGVQLATMQSLARHWGTDYDWRKCEARLNALPNFITNIDGLDIHFIHARSKHEDALPMIITHGWPGSIIEQLKVIEPLTDPTAHGGSAADAFHVVIPSLPGYGFSGKPTAPGWNPDRIARAWTTLMQRLGYTRFVAQGGDWGNVVSEIMALQEPPGLLGISTNMPCTVPAEISRALAFNEAPPATLTTEERHAWDRLKFFYTKGLGYFLEMANRPQTLYALVDSPVGLAAWMIDHDDASQAMIARVFDGKTEGLSRDDILDNVTLYWVTNTAISSARLYWEAVQTPKRGGFFDARGVETPVAVTVFPDEIYAAPRSWAEQAYPKLMYYNKVEKGTHFAAWEQPTIFTTEQRAAFRSLRARHQ
ncbi:MAG TPA: alpha/beta fold hydrolase [Gemmatimonadaceae bacterium]